MLQLIFWATGPHLQPHVIACNGKVNLFKLVLFHLYERKYILFQSLHVYAYKIWCILRFGTKYFVDVLFGELGILVKCIFACQSNQNQCSGGCSNDPFRLLLQHNSRLTNLSKLSCACYFICRIMIISFAVFLCTLASSSLVPM